MRSIPGQRIAKSILIVWRIKAFFESIFLGLIPIGYYYITYSFQWPVWILQLVIVLYVSFIMWYLFLLPYLTWKNWRYDVLDEQIELKYGVWVKKRTLIPMNRVQHVDMEQGPLMKKYQLAAVTISTAATTHVIPGLYLDEANKLRNQIVNLVILVNQDE